MVPEFEGTIDWMKFQQCLQYVQDSLVWLGSEAEKHGSSTISVFPLDAIQNTVATLKDLMHYRQRYMHNEQAQINRLPSEILSHILLHLQDSPIRLPNPRTYDRPRAQPIRSRSQASCVCRYWRQVILHTPGLWTMIRVSEESTGNFSPGMPHIPRHRSWKWAAVSLSRSGTLPVTLQFYIPDINPVRLQKDMPHLMNEAHRIQELQLIRCSGLDLQSFSPVIMKAHRLETLYLMAKSSRNYLAPEGAISYECPQLRVLSIGNSTFWRIFTVRELRHLSLAWQEWTSADFRGFLEVLGANPHLEELFLDNVNVKKEDLDDVIAFIDHLLPVHLSKLERLFIHDYTDAFVAKAYPLMTALHAILALPFHCTRLNIHENDWHYGSRPDGFDRREAFPVQRLFVTAQFLIGTDGVSACVIGRTRDDNYSLRSIHLAEVRELWLDAPARSRDESPALSAIADMENVTRLVLMRKTSFWLEKLERAFPALTEVDVFTQYSPDGPTIAQFLANRKRRGLEVTTLRFFGDPASDRCQDFTKWRESPQEFQCHVGRVAFEETSFYAEDADLLSERLGLPEACETPSPFSELWEPWRNFMIKLACKHY